MAEPLDMVADGLACLKAAVAAVVQAPANPSYATRALMAAVISAIPALASANSMPVFGSV